MSNKRETSADNDAVEIEAEQSQAEAEAEASGEHSPVEGGAPDLSHEELLLTLQDAQAKADQYWNQLLMARADMENAKKRADRDLANAHKYGVEKLALELIPVKDSMELGLAAAVEADEKVREGMALTLQMFSGVLEKFGVKEVNPQGEKFNPEFHQAMSMQESADFEPNTVITVFQKGYMLSDRLIRPAMVVVAKVAAGGNSDPQEKIDETA